jgi:uncharacterized protein
MSHHGSLLCTPEGVWAAEVASPGDIAEATFNLAFASSPRIEHFLIGTGRTPWSMPQGLRARFAARAIVPETMLTSAAVSTYNILLAEGRRIGALLIAVD